VVLEKNECLPAEIDTLRSANRPAQHPGGFGEHIRLLADLALIPGLPLTSSLGLTALRKGRIDRKNKPCQAYGSRNDTHVGVTHVTSDRSTTRGRFPHMRT